MHLSFAICCLLKCSGFRSEVHLLAANRAAWSSTTTTSTKEGLPGDDTHDDFKPQVKQTCFESTKRLHCKHKAIVAGSPRLQQDTDVPVIKCPRLSLLLSYKRSVARYLSYQSNQQGLLLQVKAEPSASVSDIIRRDLDANRVFIYMKVSGYPLLDINLLAATFQ